MTKECPLELWFPSSVYPLYQCVEAYINSAYPYCQYACWAEGDWWVCQRTGNEQYSIEMPGPVNEQATTTGEAGNETAGNGETGDARERLKKLLSKI